MQITFTRQEHTGRTNVWYDKIFLGEIFISIIENKDVDWNLFRQDKTLKMRPSERYVINFIPSIRIAGAANRSLGNFPTEEKAGHALLKAHRSYHG